jgi:hypothetical protein
VFFKDKDDDKSPKLLFENEHCTGKFYSETSVTLASTKHCNGITEDEETTYYFIKNLSLSSDITGFTKEMCVTDCSSEGVETTAK